MRDDGGWERAPLMHGSRKASHCESCWEMGGRYVGACFREKQSQGRELLVTGSGSGGIEKGGM
jgi:hypothetical protein